MTTVLYAETVQCIEERNDCNNTKYFTRFSVVGVAVQHTGTPFFMMDRANICYLGHDVNA